ncbi:MAG: rhodanese-like domain-containing protein [Elusimicrobia bacterium]|nr:rhodanese-like domain-containing protein [Elusimicrobiota bacterium]
MKALILTFAIIVTAALSCCAFDWAAFFGAGSSEKVSLVKLTEPAAGEKPGNCDFPVNIAPEEAKNFIELRNPTVIDIRTPDEYAAGHLEKVNMNLDYYAPDFKDQLAKLDKNVKYLIYCRSGGRSGKTLVMMKDMGFTEAHDIAGGINAWIAAGYPIVK